MVITKREKLEERERAIVTAATEIYLKKGYDGARMCEIASQAHIAEGTLYLYFKNKHALMQAVQDEFWQALIGGARSSLIGKVGFQDQFSTFARYHLEMLVANWKLIELSFILYYQHKENIPIQMDYKRNYVSILDSLFELGVAQGVISNQVDKYFARDHFFGTLEYAARTIIHRGVNDDAIEKTLQQAMTTLQSGLLNTSSRLSLNDTPDQKIDKTLTRLEKLADRMADLAHHDSEHLQR